MKVNRSQGDQVGVDPQRERSAHACLLVQSALSVLEDKGMQEKEKECKGKNKEREGNAKGMTGTSLGCRSLSFFKLKIF